MKLLLLALCILPFVISSNSSIISFHFEATLICRDRVTHEPLSNWCYVMEIWHDTYFPEMFDLLIVDSGDQKCVNEMATIQKIDKNETASYSRIPYSFYTKIRHNCTIDGTEIERRRTFTSVSSAAGHHDFILGIDLFEDGTRMIKGTEIQDRNPWESNEESIHPSLDINFDVL